MEFELTKADLSFINNDLKRVTEEGEFEVLVSDDSTRTVSDVDAKSKKVKEKDTDKRFLKASIYYRS